MERCDKRKNGHVRNMMEWIECFVCLCFLRCGCAHALSMKKDVDAVIESGWQHGRRVSGKNKSLEREKKGMRVKSGLREKRVFLLFL